MKRKFRFLPLRVSLALAVVIFACALTSTAVFAIPDEKAGSPSADATLQSLTASAGILYPAFSPDISDYTLGLDYTVKSSTFSATASGLSAVITVNGTVLPDDGISQQVSFPVGSTDIHIKVTAEDGITTGTYTIHARRMASVWQKVGVMPYCSANILSLCDENGALYFSAGSSIFKYDGIQWKQMLPVLSAAQNSEIGAECHIYRGVPYLTSFCASTRKGYIYKMSGSAWSQVGPTLDTGGILSYSVSSDGIYVACIKSGSTASAGKLIVLKLQDGAWKAVGSQPVSAGSAGSVSMCVSNGKVYVAYGDSTKDGKLTVRYYNGTQWATLGSEGFSNKPVYFSPVICSDGSAPYVAYIEYEIYDSDASTVHVSRFTNGAWEALGGNDLARGRLDNIAMDIDGGIPYIAYNDPNYNGKMSVFQYDGARWIQCGEPSRIQLNPSAFKLDVAGGIPYLAYYGDVDNSSAVMKFQPVNTADLSGITVSCGKLGTAFSANTLSYTVEAAGTTAAATVAPVSADSTASVLVNGVKVASGAASKPIALSFGNTVVTVSVKSRDGSQTQNYVLTIHRPYTLYLSALTLSPGALEPGFAVGTTSYTVNLNPSVTAVTIKPAFSDTKALVTINGKAAANGAAYTATLAYGKNTLTIAATSPDKTVKKTYTVNVYRHTGTWQKLGGAVKIDNNYANPSLAFLGSVPYVANCVDRVYVSKFNGTSWSALPQVTGMNSYAGRLCLCSRNGIPYVAYSGGRFANVFIDKYEKGQWKWSSGTLLAKGSGNLISFCEYKGTLYAAYTDGYYPDMVLVKKYTGTSWVAVGAGIATPDYDSYAVMDIDKATGVPYLAYVNNAHAYLKKFNGSAWVSVGSAITMQFNSKIDLSVYNGVPYIANMDGVYKWDGSAWKNLGKKFDIDDEFDLVVYNGVPYILYNDVYDYAKFTLQKLNGSVWENVGTKTFGGQRISLQFYNGVPYICLAGGYTYVIRYVQAAK